MLFSHKKNSAACMDKQTTHLYVTSDAIKIKPKAVVKHQCVWFDFYCIRRYLVLRLFAWIYLNSLYFLAAAAQYGCKHVLSSASRWFSKEVWRINSSSFTKRIFNYLQCATIPSADVCHSSYVTYQEETYSCLGIGRIPTKG